MSKFLILNFKNAGLMRKYKGTSDKIYDMFSIRDRENEPEFEEPITYFQISNVLHVLFGERPVSSVRETLYSKNEYLFNKAKNSYLKIDSYVNEKGNFQTEIRHLNKPIKNSWNTQSFMNWERAKNLLGEDLFTKFVSTIEEVFKVSISNTSFNEIKVKVLNIKDNRIDSVFDEIISKDKKYFYNYFFGVGNQISDVNRNKNSLITNIRGIEKRFSKLEGQIIVPVSDEDIEKIRTNKGTATILDGGLVYIKDLVDSKYLSPDRLGFTKLSEIKTTKI